MSVVTQGEAQAHGNWNNAEDKKRQEKQGKGSRKEETCHRESR